MSANSDLVALLQRHRMFFSWTYDGLDDEQARRRTTASELTLASLLKHVADTEAGWVAFAQGDDAAMSPEATDGKAYDPDGPDTRFVLGDADTMDALRARYAEVAAATDAFAATADLDVDRPLPPAPWFRPGDVWSVRRILTHVIAETAQHAGHADIIRESLDGKKSMG